MTTREEVKMYSDYKSPYAWLGFDPAFALEEKFAIRIKWKPFQLRIKGSGQRSVYSEYKVKYSYMDARRTANERGDKKIIRGPLKIYDTGAGADRRLVRGEDRERSSNTAAASLSCSSSASSRSTKSRP